MPHLNLQPNSNVQLECSCKVALGDRVPRAWKQVVTK